MAIRYVNFDAPDVVERYSNKAIASIELYRDGDMLVDLHGDSTVLNLTYDNRVIVLSMKLGDWSAEWEQDTPNKDRYSLTFKGVTLIKFDYEGKSMDNLGAFNSINIDNERGTVSLYLASSYGIVFSCDEIELSGI